MAQFFVGNLIVIMIVGLFLLFCWLLVESLKGNDRWEQLIQWDKKRMRRKRNESKNS